MAVLPIQGTIGDDNLSGGASDDFMYGGAGNDYLSGNDGVDNLRGGDGDDHLFGGAGNDVLNGDAGADYMDGGLGDDTYVVDNAGDVVFEGKGDGYDTVKSSVTFTLDKGIERLDLQGAANIDATGNSLDNTLKGNSGDNVLSGMDGKDSISGGDGNDTLVGGSGHDWYQGGAGNDIFVLGGVADTETAGAVNTRQLNSTSSDTVTDFIGGQDHFQVNLADFAGINAGVLQSQYFTVGIAADADHAQFIFDPTHKALLFDADGTGSGKAVKIADITNLTKMQASDILVVGAVPAAHTLTFEDVGPTYYGEVPTPYNGFNFVALSGWVGIVNNADISSYGSQNGYQTVSGNAGNMVYNYGNGDALDITRADGGDFLFQGVDVTSAWYAGEDITITGLNNGAVIFTQTVQATPTAISHLDASTLAVDEVRLSLTVTDYDTGARGGGGPYIALDNLGYDIFPHG